jgi:AraC family transcriptional activator of mtrCDE
MDVLSDILSRMKMQGTLYFRTQFSSPWAVRVPAFSNVARFHIAARGRCWIRVDGQPDPVLLEQGDLVVIPHGASHVLSDPAEKDAVELEDVIERSGFDGTGALVYGTSGGLHSTELICGHLAFAENISHPLITELPACVHLRDQSESVRLWLRHTLDVIGHEVREGALGADLVAIRLSEAICAQAIRSYLLQADQTKGIAAAMADRKIAASMTAMHSDPARGWTLDELASVAGQSRTGFAVRFKQLTGTSPMHYLTRWRMQIAHDLLSETGRGLADIAQAVGYGSESAFSRAFKVWTGRSPSDVR